METGFSEADRAAVQAYFRQCGLSSQQKLSLERQLLSQPTPSDALRRTPLRLAWFLLGFCRDAVRSWPRLTTAGASTLLTAALCFTLFYGRQAYQPEPDPLFNVANLSENLEFPADFNLEGDLDELPDLVEDTLPDRSFFPQVPRQLVNNFSAYEGRFFMFHGEQGVGIRVQPIKPAASAGSANLARRVATAGKVRPADTHATLYIVKLSEKNGATFPKRRVASRVLSASGKIKRISAWREGAYGYAMVQSAPPYVSYNDEP